ncbi:reverse transcriptase domain-containing protein [Erythrobacter aurantius]|uniref:reverse transcriptase domain-containing protein n=1 Tax=Erythrobacter aurantius TaxID=2909249 RepID=UPI00207A11B7|nr:reverse transcriptase domain-containing protein [Erythrobacter aurantius]
MTCLENKSDECFFRQVRHRITSKQGCPNDLTLAEQHRFTRIARAKERRDREKIALSVAEDNLRKARRLQREYIHSFAARFVAASDKTVVRNCEMKRRFTFVYSRAQMIGFNAQPGTMMVWKKPKADGGTRILGQFRDTDLAQQTLLARSILPFLGDRPDQYGQRGGNLAVETLRDHAETAGPDAVFLHGDVRQFYDHVSPEWLRENVPLPESLKPWIFTSGYTVSSRVTRRPALRITEEEIERMSQRGLPQGSALSPLIAEMVIQNIIAEVGSLRAYPLVNYSDNFGLVVPAQEAERLEQTLRVGFRSHPAGPFDIRFTRRPLSQECRFGGYSFSVTPEGACAFWVRELDWLGRFAYFSDQLQNGPAERVPQVLKRMHGYCQSWPLWSGTRSLRCQWEAHAASVLEARALSELIPYTFLQPED